MPIRHYTFFNNKPFFLSPLAEIAWSSVGSIEGLGLRGFALRFERAYQTLDDLIVSFAFLTKVPKFFASLKFNSNGCERHSDVIKRITIIHCAKSFT